MNDKPASGSSTVRRSIVAPAPEIAAYVAAYTPDGRIIGARTWDALPAAMEAEQRRARRRARNLRLVARGGMETV